MMTWIFYWRVLGEMPKKQKEKDLQNLITKLKESPREGSRAEVAKAC